MKGKQIYLLLFGALMTVLVFSAHVWRMDSFKSQAAALGLALLLAMGFWFWPRWLIFTIRSNERFWNFRIYSTACVGPFCLWFGVLLWIVTTILAFTIIPPAAVLTLPSFALVVSGYQTWRLTNE